MSADPNQIRQAINNAREALRRSDKADARHWAEHAVRIAPELEDAWLLMAAVSSPRASVEYAKSALVINPQSERARKALDWARNRPGADEPVGQVANLPNAVPVRRIANPQEPYNGQSAASLPLSPKKINRRGLIYALLLSGLVCIVVVAFAAWSASRSPVLASIVNSANDPVPTSTQESYFAVAEVAKPTYTPEWTATPTVTPTDTPTTTPSITPTPEFTSTPLPTDTPLPTETPGMMEVAIVPDTPTPVRPPTKEYVAPTQQAYVPPGSNGGNGARWIDVNLSQQRVYAYEGDVVVNSFIASTGTWQTPTVTGKYKIYVKYVSTTMAGPGYNLPNVPYTMYFYKGYGIHGTYWHNNFGTPMSHGCVNLSITNAEWLYYWASVGTVVNVHY
jgi:lipoprotein-anchoring transpeptidase ErfK/SrfK